MSATEVHKASGDVTVGRVDMRLDVKCLTADDRS
jgi:hypothetical protein